MKAIKLANTELEKFLREKRVYQRFIKNATMKKTWGIGEADLSGADTLKMTQSFSFKSSKEGQDFWYDLHTEFQFKNK